MPAAQDSFMKLVKHPLRFRVFLFTRLPAAWFSGVRVKNINGASCAVTIRYSWFSTNPFRSTYFACLAMAAEMSTGILVFSHTYQRVPAVSMLVTGLKAEFLKKATGITTFTCSEGDRIGEAVKNAITTGTAQTITVNSVGVSDSGEPLARFEITWSFKMKST